MSSPMPIRTAILGFGVSGRVFHAPFIAANPAYSLNFISTSNVERIASVRDLYPETVVIAQPMDVFDHADQLDLVVLSTPPGTHYELAKAAIAHGLHVVIDKPFVPRTDQAAELISLANAADVTLTVFQNRRWDGDFLTLKKLVESGELGRVRTFESRFEWWKPQGFRDWKATTSIAEGGGILFDLGSHLIDQAIQLFGPVIKVHAETARHSGHTDADGDEEAFVSLVHESGTKSRLMMNGIAALNAPRFHVLGSEAGYTKWGLDGQEPALIAGTLPTDSNYGLEAEETWGTFGVPGSTHRVPAERGAYDEFYALLATCLREGGVPPIDPRDAAEVLRVIELAHRAARA
ncbi:Gfo/Idh/MocA family oxidoreductase [Rhodoglobus sp. NPDC076762]